MLKQCVIDPEWLSLYSFFSKPEVSKFFKFGTSTYSSKWVDLLLRKDF